ECPEWMLEDRLVREFLKARFPRYATCPKQRRQATLWGYVVIRYFRDGQSDIQIAIDLNGGRSAEKRKRTKAIVPDVKNTDLAYWDEVLKSHGVNSNERTDKIEWSRGERKFRAA